MTASNGNSGSLQLGLVLPPCPEPDEMWQALDNAERGGLHSVWVTDRTMGPGGIPWLETLSALSAVAARTTTLRVGTSIFVPARRNPVLSAHALASIDHMSRGRLIVGVGLGGLEPRDFELADTRLDQRAHITDEYIPLYRQLWSNPVSDANGNFYSCPGVGFGPLPHESIPIWIGGSSPAAIDRAARLGDGWLSIFLTPEQFVVGSKELDGVALRNGRDPNEITRANYMFGAIGESTQEAEAVLRPAVEGLFGAPFEQMASALVWGTPDDWSARLAEYSQAGVSVANTLLFSTRLDRDTKLLAEVASSLSLASV